MGILWYTLVLACLSLTFISNYPILVFILCLPMGAANMDQHCFPNIPFKVFKDFVYQNFSSSVSLTAVLFSLTENPDLLNLHSHQNNPLFEGEKRQGSFGWIKCLARAVEQHLRDTVPSKLPQCLHVFQWFEYCGSIKKYFSKIPFVSWTILF